MAEPTLSSSTSRFLGNNYERTNYNAFGNFNSGSSPQDSYDKYKKEKSGVVFYSFPPDQPEYRMILVARDYPTGASSLNSPLGQAGLSSSGTAKAGFVLPLPSMRMIDKYQVGYDDNFAYLEGIPSRLTNSTAGRLARGATGLNLNKFKSVLLDTPYLKRHEFSWKLAPKNLNESNLIRNIVNILKVCMAPNVVGSTAGTVISFPYIFDIAFNDNADKLYGFKPSVLESLEVDYSGGNVQPSLYHNGFAESVIINATVLEIEFWVRSDYEQWHLNSVNGTLNPYDTLMFNNSRRANTGPPNTDPIRQPDGTAPYVPVP